MKIFAIGLVVACAVLAARTELVEQAPANAREMQSPYAEGDACAIRAGEKLYQRECAPCHGKDAQGRRKTPPLIAAHVTNAPQGSLYWVLRNGSVFHGMPSFSYLPDQQRWQIVAYLKSLPGRKHVR